MDRTTLTRSLELLKKQDLIQIESSSDRRKRIVTITSKGEAKMDKAFHEDLKELKKSCEYVVRKFIEKKVGR